MLSPHFNLICIPLKQIGQHVQLSAIETQHIHVLCPVSRAYSPDPLTGHISGICPNAQQRPVSQQHCILVYWPESSAAQRPFARAEKQVPTR